MKPILLLAAVTAFAQPRPTRILVAYYSETGYTEKLAQSIGKGAASVAGVEVALRKTADVKDDDIPGYDGILLGTPVQWSNVSAEAKRFLDRAWRRAVEGQGLRRRPDRRGVLHRGRRGDG